MFRSIRHSSASERTRPGSITSSVSCVLQLVDDFGSWEQDESAECILLVGIEKAAEHQQQEIYKEEDCYDAIDMPHNNNRMR